MGVLWNATDTEDRVCVCVRTCVHIHILNITFSYAYLFLRENMSGGGLDRDKERENPKQASHCQHAAWHWAQSHGSWDHNLSWSQESDI